MKHLYNVWLQGQNMVTTIMANSGPEAGKIFIARNNLTGIYYYDLNIKEIY